MNEEQHERRRAPHASRQQAEEEDDDWLGGLLAIEEGLGQLWSDIVVR